MSGTKAPQSGDGHSLAGAAARTPLFVPSSMDIAASQITEFIRYFEEKEKKKFNKYSAFERIAVDDFRAFWLHFIDWSGVIYNGDLFPVCTSDRCEEAVFFPNLRLNYVENLLSHGNDCDAKFEIPALTAYHLERPAERLSRRELRHRVSTLAAALRDLGLGPESRVVIVAHNTAGAVVGCLAAAAIGCSVSTAAPEMGVFALVSRFAQIEPALLMCDLHGVYVGRERHQYQRLAETVQSLPSLRGVLLLDQGPIPEGLPVPVYRAAELMAACDGAVMNWQRFPFNHPLFILFTSGTTGVPKCIVHGAGGTLLEHLKEHQLHCNLGERDKLFFQTSIGWMMWNWQLTALASGAELVVYDGPLASVDLLWRIVAEEEVTVFGTSPAYIQISGASTAPIDKSNFDKLRAILSTGSLLYERHQAWVWNNIKPLPVQSISGGTDIVGCFVLGNPNLPSYSGESQCRSLAMDVRALGAGLGTPIGELVCANPFPSRPVGFLNDPAGKRVHAAYFAQNPGVWTHGDLIELTPEGTARIHGRSDGVLNIRGIRIGPAEIYRILDGIPEILEAMAVEQHAADEPGNARLVLLVVLKPGVLLHDVLVERIKRELGRRGSPAHVPAAVLAVDELPTTHSGKRSERSARDALNGNPVGNLEALHNPGCLEPLRQYAAAPHELPATAGERVVEIPAAISLEVMTTIWEDVLHLPTIGPDENFFDLGGDSLAALQLSLKIQVKRGRELPITLLFDSPTIRSLTAAVSQAGPAPFRPLVLLKESDRGRPLFIVHGIGGLVMELMRLGKELKVDGPVYAIQAKGFDPDHTPHRSVEMMAGEYLAAIREVQPSGPYLLAGYSFGGLVAYEMARVLEKAGEKIALLALIDTGIHERQWPWDAWLEYLSRQMRRQLQTIRGLRAGEVPSRLMHLCRVFVRRIGRSAGASFALNDTTGKLPPTYQRVRDAHVAAMAYTVIPTENHLVLFRSDLREASWCDPARVWPRFAPVIEVCEVPGAHLALMREPQVRVLAKELSRFVQAANVD